MSHQFRLYTTTEREERQGCTINTLTVELLNNRQIERFHHWLVHQKESFIPMRPIFGVPFIRGSTVLPLMLLWVRLGGGGCTPELGLW